MGKGGPNCWRNRWPAPLYFVFLLLITGCGTKDAWRTAYRANYEKAYQAAWETGSARGKEEGEKQGEAEAREAAKAGRAWLFYAKLTYRYLAIGLVVGIVVQYAILFLHANNGTFPGPATFAFIPGMKTSMCYSEFVRRYQLLAEFDEELEKVGAVKNLKLAQIQAIHDIVKARVMAASSLEELTRERLLEIANAEFDKIVSEAETINQT